MRDWPVSATSRYWHANVTNLCLALRFLKSSPSASRAAHRDRRGLCPLGRHFPTVFCNLYKKTLLAHGVGRSNFSNGQVNAHKNMSCRAGRESPIISLPALLELVGWLEKRVIRGQGGTPPCNVRRIGTSPPAPDPLTPEGTLARPAGDDTPEDRADAGQDRGPTGVSSLPKGGDA